MNPRLQGQNCKFFKTPVSRNSQRRLQHKENKTKYRKMTRKPRSLVSILIYRTWAITCDWIMSFIVALNAIDQSQLTLVHPTISDITAPKACTHYKNIHINNKTAKTKATSFCTHSLSGEFLEWAILIQLFSPAAR